LPALAKHAENTLQKRRGVNLMAVPSGIRDEAKSTLIEVKGEKDHV
jgi:hypothetical protein